MLRQESFVQTHLVSIGWRWGSQYGGHDAGQMIMHTVANRVRCGWGSWLDVITNIPKYMAENEMPVLKFPSVWEPSFVKLLHVVDGIYDGSVVDKSNGALYWGDLTRIERPWFKDLIAAVNDPVASDGSDLSLRSHPIVANLNSLTFFR